VGSRVRRAPPSPAVSPRRRPPRNIVLTGFMGSGKTSVGRALARLLGWRFRDLDSIIEGRAGMGVAEVFASRGEQWFRKVEGKAIFGLGRLRNTVIATGGGAPVRSRNRALLKAAGLVVYLKVPPSILARRLGTGRGRPLLGPANGNPGRVEALVCRLLRARAKHYLKAGLVFGAGRGTPAAVARSLARVLRSRYGGGL